ncbi:MAG: class II aldolase/adducin family protein [Lachnospiraceae bacterium]|nr:class II aldolase/adducin family protein [Lachnospiraceae bacterium]
MNVGEIKQTIIEYSKDCYENGLVSAAGGNISMCLGDRFFITATNAALRHLTPEDIVEVDIDGNIVGESYGRRPSKEVFMHLEVFKNREDIDSIIHIHPVFTISCTITKGRDFPLPTVSSKLKLRKMGYVEYADAGSIELKEGVREASKDRDINIILLEGHGIVVYDKGMEKCYNTAELLEETAKINCITSMMK